MRKTTTRGTKKILARVILLGRESFWEPFRLKAFSLIKEIMG